MSAKRVMVRCHQCDGVGKVELNGCYADTLRALWTYRDEVTAAEMAREFGVNHTAMCNRLAALASMGLARRRRYGRCVYYSARRSS